ncbi:acyl-CoA thioesterase [Algoriphagus mannitolivorans]|uniref:acyl-CoA thioesterase n=1 Tax=Algoriphagus mannitolivorans TaxID=226504 RepID=UPI00042896DF|nr:thioesterase family protein [Algoriphagus mannitolivorans]
MQALDPEKLKEDFQFSTPIQLRFSDIDGYLHVNNGVYFNYFEHARAVYLYKVCKWDIMKVGTVVGRIEIDYLRPIHLTDQVEALVRCSKIGNTSFHLEQILLGKSETGESLIFAKCTCIMVSVDMRSMKPVPVPEEYREKLAAS